MTNLQMGAISFFVGIVISFFVPIRLTVTRRDRTDPDSPLSYILVAVTGISVIISFLLG